MSIESICAELYDLVEPLHRDPRYVPWRKFVPHPQTSAILEIRKGYPHAMHEISKVEALLEEAGCRE